MSKYTINGLFNAMAITNTPQSEQDTADKYSTPANTVKSYITGVTPGIVNDMLQKRIQEEAQSDTPSSEPEKETSAPVTSNGQPMTFNHRVKLLVPQSYVQKGTIASGPNNELSSAQGIIFPYTPQITQEYKATYNAINPTHSNYTQYFFKNSAPGEISLTAKFTVQNQKEAGIYLSVVHLLRSLIKMKFGDEPGAGSPPPICRLQAYGTYMLDKVPVALTSFRLELLDNIDYITTDVNSKYGMVSVPVQSTFQLSLLPIYSRAEMQKGTVAGWLSSTENQRAQGYL